MLFLFIVVFGLSIIFEPVYRFLTCTNRASTNLGSVLRKELRQFDYSRSRISMSVESKDKQWIGNSIYEATSSYLWYR